VRVKMANKSNMRYSIEQLFNMAITKEDHLKANIIFERYRNPRSSLIKTALNNNTTEKHVSAIFSHFLRGSMIWFECEDQELRRLFSDGLSDSSISKIMNTTVGSIFARRKKLGLTKHKKILDEELFVYEIQVCINKKLSRKEAAKKLGVHETTIGNYCKKHGLSFRKYGSESHCSKVNSYDRALICTLADLNYLPEHIAKVVDLETKTIRTVIYDTPSIEHIDVTKNPRVMQLLNCEIDGGHYLTPAEVELFKSKGLDAYMKKTGKTEAAAMMAFVYREQPKKYERYAYKS